ncbi:hypothetical protein [Spirillospora sp. CA-294931]|uniref:hypothetical protein n=1 Tax=Spirillospora sp. CA-294931 TaxID=3240042 RepID=UPI003D8E7E7D
MVVLAGSEISLFNHGFLPGLNLEERLGLLANPERLRAVLPGLHERVNDFLGRAVAAVRARFGGRVSYASLPFEGVDWTPFDLVATDAGYRDAATASGFRESLRAQVARGKPFAVTEFGCATYRGAADRGGRGDSILEWDERARPVRLTARVVRDEQEQAAYLRELLDIFDEEGVDTAFVNTFASRDRPASDAPERDFDTASFGIVKILESGGSEPKAAFHTLAEYGRTRAASSKAGQGEVSAPRARVRLR